MTKKDEELAEQEEVQTHMGHGLRTFSSLCGHHLLGKDGRRHTNQSARNRAGGHVEHVCTRRKVEDSA